jgi:hypothetical protein
MTSSKIAMSVAAATIFAVITPASTEQNEPGAGGEIFERCSQSLRRLTTVKT